MKKLIVSKENPNGILVDLTSEEISIREKDLEHIKALKILLI